MKYRRLGRTNLKVSVIGVGTWQFGGAWGKAFAPAEVAAMLGRARDLGINVVDTAECYGGDHVSEKLIGAAMKRERDHWIVATKFGHNTLESSEDPKLHWQPHKVREQLEASLKALATDYIDIYQFHSGTNDVFDNDELWTMLHGQVQAGKIRHLGISPTSGNLETQIHQTREATHRKVDVMQILYNRLQKSAEGRVFDACIEQDLGVFVRVPLASGLLSGRYRPGARWGEGDVRHHRNQQEVDRMLGDVERIQQGEVPARIDLAKWALSWCLEHPATTVVIPGCKSIEQVESNAAAAELVADNHRQAWT